MSKLLSLLHSVYGDGVVMVRPRPVMMTPVSVAVQTTITVGADGTFAIPTLAGTYESVSIPGHLFSIKTLDHTWASDHFGTVNFVDAKKLVPDSLKNLTTRLTVPTFPEASWMSEAVHLQASYFDGKVFGQLPSACGRTLMATIVMRNIIQSSPLSAELDTALFDSFAPTLKYSS